MAEIVGDVKNRTITSIFIVPTLKIDRNELKSNNFINGYIRDLNREEEYDDAAYLLFKPKNLEKFNDFVKEEYERGSDIVEDYDYDGGFVVLVYTLDSEFKNDFELVKKGKYSKTSQEFQELFPKIVKVVVNGRSVEEMGIQHRVFNKTEDLKDYWEDKIGQNLPKDMEFWKGFEIEKETLDIEKLKQLI